MSGFESFVMEHAPAAEKDLHLTHCTSGGVCFDILKRMSLNPRPCAEFDEDLLYLFYGRPAYKPNASAGASSLDEMAPVCLVIDPEVANGAVRVFPFDSGGYARYEPEIGPQLTRERFEMGTERTGPLRLIGAYYETTGHYYLQESRPGLHIPASKREAAAYARLIADVSINEDDDRRGTIEIQLNTPISLRESLRALIAPASFLEDPEVVAALAQCPKAVPLDYRTFGRMRPANLAWPIYNQLYGFLVGEERI